MKKINRLAIIPARKGSKRIKNKNLKLFKNKPLIFYSINAAINSKLFDKIHVSTDSKEIFRYAENRGLKNDFIRPKILAGDHIALAPVMEYVVEKYRREKKFFDQVWLIYATNPFVNELIIKNCDKKFKKIAHSPNNALMTISKFNKPVQWAQKINSRGYLEPISKKKLKVRSQDLIEYYYDAGMINIFSGKRFYDKLKNIKFYPYKINNGETFDIDTQEDFNLASKIYKLKY